MDIRSRKVCVMQDAETVLDVLRERGRRGLPLERLYRQLFNPQCICWPMGVCTPTMER